MADRGMLFLIVGYIGAVGLGAYEMQRTPATVPESSGQTVRNQPPLDLPTTAIRNIAAYDAIIERPLFAKDRRPQAEADGVEIEQKPRGGDPSTGVEGLRLTAVLNDRGSMTALLEDRSGKTRALQLGEQLGDWRVQEILDESVVIVSDKGQETLVVHQFDPVAPNRNLRRAPVSTGRRITRRPTQPTTEEPVVGRRTPAALPEEP
jgi:hypothetical protein